MILIEAEETKPSVTVSYSDHKKEIGLQQDRVILKDSSNHVKGCLTNNFNQNFWVGSDFLFNLDTSFPEPETLTV